MPRRTGRWWPALLVVALLVLMGILLVRMAGPRQPGMPGTGTINYGTPAAAPATPATPETPSMPGMDMGGSGK